MLTKEELDQINRFSKAELTADQVYTFSVRLCDNEVDRDFERFGTEDLDRLGELFLGKSGIFDHQWSAKGQTARIYRTDVVREPGTVTAAGDEYRWLKGWAYLMRTEKNQELITEIEGGIKKEVSVGCSMGRSVCSVCGAENGACGHVKGQMYGEKLCFMKGFPTSADIYLELDGRKIAVVQSYRAKAAKSSKNIEAFGESEPVATIEGQKSYTVELTRLYATDTAISDGIDFYNLTDFSLVICKPDRKVIYSGCEWSGIQEDGELNATVAERVTLTAARRIETTA